MLSFGSCARSRARRDTFMVVRCHRYTEVNIGGRDTAGRSRSGSCCFFPLTTDALDVLISRKASPPPGIPYSNSISPATTSQNATGAARNVKRVPRAVCAWPPHALQAGPGVDVQLSPACVCVQLSPACVLFRDRHAQSGERLKVLIRTPKRGNLIACKWQSGMGASEARTPPSRSSDMWLGAHSHAVPGEFPR